MSPYLGQDVLYRLRPGQIRQGQTEAAGKIRRVHADNSVNLIVWPDGMADPLLLDRVPAQTDPGQTHCWRALDDGVNARFAALETEVRDLRRQLGRRRETVAA